MSGLDPAISASTVQQVQQQKRVAHHTLRVVQLSRHGVGSQQKAPLQLKRHVSTECTLRGACWGWRA